MTRDTWTDERLDDLNAKVDRGFDKVDARFDKVDARFERLEDKIDSRFEAMNRRLLTFAGMLIVGSFLAAWGPF